MDGLLRTHYCTGLKEDDIGKKSTVTGWVQGSRDMGGIIFLDLRDKTGQQLLQINQHHPSNRTTKRVKPSS